MDKGLKGYTRRFGIVEWTWRKSDFWRETRKVPVHHGCVAEANDERLSDSSSSVPLEERCSLLLSFTAALLMAVGEQLTREVPNEVNAEGAGNLDRDRPPL